MSDTRAWLDEVEQRAESATPGPWAEDHDAEDVINNTCVTVGDYGWIAWGPNGQSPAYDEDSTQGRNDAEFIAHARTDVPRLVDAIRAVLDLHVRRPHGFGDFVHFGQTEFPDLCGHCRTDFPCPTVRAVTEHLGES